MNTTTSPRSGSPNLIKSKVVKGILTPLVHKEMVADQQGGDHRLGWNLEGFDYEGAEYQGEENRQTDRLSVLAQSAFSESQQM